MITIVTGLPRSGTSLTMQMIRAAGFPVFHNREPNCDEHNPHGYFEVAEFARKSFFTQDNRALLKQCDGKVVKMFPYCFPALSPEFDYQFIHLLRPIEEIAKSQRKMLAAAGKNETVSETFLDRAEWQCEIFVRRFQYYPLPFEWLFREEGPRLIQNFLLSTKLSSTKIPAMGFLAMLHCVDPSLHPVITE